MTKHLNVLVYDIETAPILAYVWGTREQNIANNQIAKDKHVIAWAAKWMGKPKSSVIYADQRNVKRIEDDRELLKPLWKLLDEADIVVTQNGKNFDSPVLNARFIEHGMPPPSPYKHLDTYQIARSAAAFTSHKLEYLTDKLCSKYKKLAHKKFPGFSLWAECLKGNVAAWNEMRRYNIHDVLATEELYTKLQAWAPQNAAKPFVICSPSTECSTCGVEGKITKQGIKRTKCYSYQQLKCQACGSWQQGDRVKEGKPNAA